MAETPIQEACMSDTREKPYQVTLHWDPSRQGAWTGFGADLNPACGHSEWITVTGMPEAVDCQKCRSKLEKPTP